MSFICEYSELHVTVQGTLLVAQLVEALRYKPEGRGVRFPIVSLKVSIDIILRAALLLWD